MATKSGQEPEGRAKRQRQSILQRPDGRDAQSPCEETGQDPRTEEAQGQLPSADGQCERPVDEGWEEDPFETQFRGMGSLW